MKQHKDYTIWEETPLKFHYFIVYVAIPLPFVIDLFSLIVSFDALRFFPIAVFGCSLICSIAAFYLLLKRRWMGPSLLIAQRLLLAAVYAFEILTFELQYSYSDATGKLLGEMVQSLIGTCIIYFYYKKRRLLFSPLPAWYTPPRKTDGPWTPPADWAAATWSPPSDWAAAELQNPSHGKASPLCVDPVTPTVPPSSGPIVQESAAAVVSESIQTHETPRQTSDAVQQHRHKVSVRVNTSAKHTAAPPSQQTAPLDSAMGSDACPDSDRYAQSFPSCVGKQDAATGAGKKPTSAKKLPILLGCVCFILAVSTTVLGILYFGASKQIALQETSLEEQTEEISWLNTKCSMKEKQLDDATESKSDLQSEVSRLQPYQSLVENQLGFIVDDSDIYHNYDCAKVQQAESCLIMDVVACSRLGLKYCPLCWPSSGPLYLHSSLYRSSG